MKKNIGLCALTLLAALFVSGCATVTETSTHGIPITTSPEGATVVANGTEIGTTPLIAHLPRNRTQEITVEKPGFATENATLRSAPNHFAERQIRFRMDQETGADHSLEPAFLHFELHPLILPDAPGENAFGELSGKIVEVDDQLESGEINRAEHRYILSRLLRFYQQ